MLGRGHPHIERGLQIGLVEAGEHPLGVGGFELRVQVGLIVHRVDEAVQALAGVGVAAVGVDDDHIVVGESPQRDAGRFVVSGDIEFVAVEGGAADGFGGDVDDRVGAGQGIEHHGGDGAESSLAGSTVAVGDVEVDLVAVDGDQGGAFDRLVPGEVRKSHASNLERAVPQGRRRCRLALQNGNRRGGDYGCV